VGRGCGRGIIKGISKGMPKWNKWCGKWGVGGGWGSEFPLAMKKAGRNCLGALFSTGLSRIKHRG
jgi:hypothetical protein